MFLSARSVATSRTLGPIRQRFGTMDDPPINSPSACCRSPQVALSESLASVARLSFGYPPAAHPSNDGILDRRFVECLGSCPRQQSPHCRQLPCKLAGVGACTYARARARAYMLLCVLGHLDASDSPPAVAAAGRARASVARHLAGPVGTKRRSSEAGRERRIQKCLGLIGTPAPQPVPRTASTLPVSAGVHRRSVVECMAACSTDLVLDVHQTMPCDLRKPTCAVTEQRHRKHGMCRSKQKKGAP